VGLKYWQDQMYPNSREFPCTRNWQNFQKQVYLSSKCYVQRPCIRLNITGLESQYGSIREGKKADLLLLSKNPIVAIENTKTVSSIIFDGRHLDQAFLEQLKQK
jgi:N-acetylglucosamine-6-phosphate deacetylase